MFQFNPFFFRSNKSLTSTYYCAMKERHSRIVFQQNKKSIYCFVHFLLTKILTQNVSCFVYVCYMRLINISNFDTYIIKINNIKRNKKS